MVNQSVSLRDIKTRSQLPALAASLGIASYVEVGVWRGYFFQKMLAGVILATAVDPWDAALLGPALNIQSPQSLQDRYYQNMLDLTKRNTGVTVLRMTSLQAAKALKGMRFDLVYIDANHTFRAVSEDLRAWAPLVAPGRYLAGHDYTSQNGFGVKNAVDEFQAETGWRFHRTQEQAMSSWFLEKPQ